MHGSGFSPAPAGASTPNVDGETIVINGSGDLAVNPNISSITYGSTITPADASAFQIYRCILTGDVTVEVPTGTIDGSRIELWLTASGGARNVSFNASIIVPTSSAFTSPFSLTSGKKVKCLLEYDATLNGGQWELTSFIPGY